MRFVPIARLRRPGPLSSRLAELGTDAVELPAAAPGPSLGDYDVIAVSMSGGKDSQAAFEVTCRAAAELGLLHRVVAVHASLGADEWPDTETYAAAQAARWDVPLAVVSRIGQIKKTSRGELYAKGETFGDMDDYVRRRRRSGIARAWYRRDARFCTSEFKRGPLNAAAATLVKSTRRKMILSVRGMRAEESTARKAMAPFCQDKRFSSSARHMDVWLPVHHWTEREVWALVRDSGSPHHWAYDLGMPRLSCSFCMLAGKAPLTLAGHYNRARLVAKVDLEDELGEPFKKDAPLREVLDLVDAGVWPKVLPPWRG